MRTTALPAPRGSRGAVPPGTGRVLHLLDGGTTMNPEDEPLDHWAARREGRLRKPGELKSVTLAPGPQQAAHVNPDAPRLILEWDGYQWTTKTVAENYAAACRILNPGAETQAAQVASHTPRLGKGTGRHRKS
ncbi:DUF6087 family protein [Streptomyces sp. NPDC006670]|uniref:DUF6087 family protein n=1 Tax=Streptomyces sp. NPDC006670 TaxID=3154476 RepID=UPI0033FFE28A